MEPQTKIIKCEDIHGNIHQRNSDEFIFRPSCYGIVIKDNKILLVPQFDGYDLPGGGVEIYETIEEGLLREVWEETGYTVKKKALVDINGSFFLLPGREDQPVNSILIYFTCEIVSGEISTENFDEFEKEYAKAAEWVDLDKLDELKFYTSTDVKSVIKHVLNS